HSARLAGILICLAIRCGRSAKYNVCWFTFTSRRVLFAGSTLRSSALCTNMNWALEAGLAVFALIGLFAVVEVFAVVGVSPQAAIDNINAISRPIRIWFFIFPHFILQNVIAPVICSEYPWT